MNDELMDVLKMVADKRMGRTIEGLLSKDAAYRKLSRSAYSMKRVCDTLNLDSGIKIVVDQPLVERDRMNMEKTPLAYWAGMTNTIIILRSMDIITLV